MRFRFQSIIIIPLLLAVSACGFRPIYATSAQNGAPLNQRIVVGDVAAPETVQPILLGALSDRMVLNEGENPKYELNVTARESAQRLAVQIDATVTRYNYRLSARYTLTDLATGAVANGRAQAVTSYNIVSSQYSTLFAERTAQEKAAKRLAEEIERDLLLRFSESDSGATTTPVGLDPETEILQEPRSGEVIGVRREDPQPELSEPRSEDPDEIQVEE